MTRNWKISVRSASSAMFVMSKRIVAAFVWVALGAACEADAPAGGGDAAGDARTDGRDAASDGLPPDGRDAASDTATDMRAMDAGGPGDAAGGGDPAMCGVVNCTDLAALMAGCIPVGDCTSSHPAGGDNLCWPNGVKVEIRYTTKDRQTFTYSVGGKVCYIVEATVVGSDASFVWKDPKGGTVATWMGPMTPAETITITCGDKEDPFKTACMIGSGMCSSGTCE